MRLYEIDESQSFSKILQDCAPYMEAISYRSDRLPIRSVSMEQYEIKRVATPSDRDSIYLNYPPIKRMLGGYFKEHNIASRYENVFFTSSLGDNTEFFLLDEHSGYAIPIGEFQFSYVYNDFNSSADLESLIETLSMADRVIDRHYSEFKDRFDNCLYGAEIVTLIDCLTEFLDNISSEQREAIEKALPMDQIKAFTKGTLTMLESIKTDNLEQAFQRENEIWFNTSHYYFIPHNNGLSEKFREFLHSYKGS